eukprot:COSAG02_NODE_702_length_18327_cov_85.154597_9_plen_310_part_00
MVVLLDWVGLCQCKEDLIADTKANLTPASFIVYAVLIFCLVAALINDSMIDAADFSGVTGILGLVFNGAVAFSGFVLTIAATIGQYLLSQDCQGRESCSNVAVDVVVILGLALVGLGVLGVIGVQKNRAGGGIAARTALRNTNLVLICVSFVLSVAGILLSLAGGGMESINGASEKNFAELRTQMEAQDASYCREDGESMSDEACRAKIAQEIEDNVMVVGVVALSVAFGLFAVIVLTFRIIKQLKSDPEEVRWVSRFNGGLCCGELTLRALNLCVLWQAKTVDDFLDQVDLQTQDNPATFDTDDEEKK